MPRCLGWTAAICPSLHAIRWNQLVLVVLCGLIGLTPSMAGARSGSSDEAGDPRFERRSEKPNQPPRARLRVKNHTRKRHAVNTFGLDARRSRDRDGEVVSYEFVIVSRETGEVFLSNGAGEESQVTVDMPPGRYRASVTVEDDDGATHTRSRRFRVRGRLSAGSSTSCVATADDLYEVTLDGGPAECASSDFYSMEDTCPKAVTELEAPWEGCRDAWKDSQSPPRVFNTLQTVQFLMKSRTNPASLSFETKKSQGTTAFNCMVGFAQGREPILFKIDGGSFAIPKWALTKNETPVHLTFIPFHSKDGTTCTSQDGAIFDTGDSDESAAPAIAVWINWPVTPPTQKALGVDYLASCTLSEVDSSGFPVHPSGQNCDFQKPKWSLIKDASGKAEGLRFEGTLNAMLAAAAKRGKTEKTAISIQIDTGVELKFPVTSQYVEFPADATTDVSACETALATYNAQNGQPGVFVSSDPFPTACKISDFDSNSVAYKRSYTYSAANRSKIIVGGAGKIDGQNLIEAWKQSDGYPASGPCAKSHGVDHGDVSVCTTRDEKIQYAEWRVRSSLLGLSSSYSNPKDTTKNFSIDVSGVTVSNPPHRNRASVELNVPGIGPPGKTPSDSNYDANNLPVRVYDFKQVGAWSDAADGPEVSGFRSFVNYVYLHSNDDSVKISGPRVTYAQATVLQGNSGGVINIGAYGYNRTVQGSTVERIWVPRITQTKPDQDLSGDISSKWFSATRGVVVAPTCMIGNQVDKPNSKAVGSLEGVTVDTLRVFALGNVGTAAGGTPGPNSIAAPVAVGVFDASVDFCSLPTSPDPRPFKIGNFQFLDLTFDVNPQADTFLFSKGYDAAKKNIQWDTVSFCEATGNKCQFAKATVGPAKLPVKPMKMRSPVDTPKYFYYYVCGETDSASASANCWNREGQGGGTGSGKAATAPNVNYYWSDASSPPASPYKGKLVYPYGAAP